MDEKHRAHAALMIILDVYSHIRFSTLDDDYALVLLKRRLPELKEPINEDGVQMGDFIFKHRNSLSKAVPIQNKVKYYQELFNYSTKEIMTFLDVSRPTVMKYKKMGLREMPEPMKPLKIQDLEFLYFDIHKAVNEPKPYPYFVL